MSTLTDIEFKLPLHSCSTLPNLSRLLDFFHTADISGSSEKVRWVGCSWIDLPDCNRWDWARARSRNSTPKHTSYLVQVCKLRHHKDHCWRIQKYTCGCSFGHWEIRRRRNKFDLSSFESWSTMWILFTICPGGHFCWRFLAAKPRFVLNVSRRGHNIQIIQGAAPKDGQCDESWIGKRFVAQLGSYCRLPMSQQSPNIRYFRSQISRWILWTFRWQYPLISRWFCTVLGRTRCRGTQPLCPSVRTLCSTCQNRDHRNHHKDHT